MSGKPIANPGEDCPLWQKDVSEVCHKCPFYTQLRGSDPQTGKDIDDWGCVIAWQPILTIELASKMNGVAASLESFRNEMVKQQRNVTLLENLNLRQ